MPFRQEGRRSNNYNQGSPTNTPPAPGLPPEGLPALPLPPMPVFSVPYPTDPGIELTNPNPISEIPYSGPPMTFPEVTPPTLPSPFPTGEILSPTAVAAIESSIPNPTTVLDMAGGPNPFMPFGEPPPPPQVATNPLAPIGGRGPASPQTPKPTNPFGGGR